MLDFYFEYRRVIARFRRDALGNEMDRIATELSKDGYKRGSAKMYLARIAHFSTYAAECGCGKDRPIPREVVDRYLLAKSTTASRWMAQVAIGHAVRCCPDRFERVTPTPDPDGPLLEDFLEHLRIVRGLHVRTCEGLVLTARRMLKWHKKNLCDEPLSQLTAKHVLAMTHDMVCDCCSDAARASTTARMRAFLRYLYWANLNERDLAQFVWAVRGWRHAHLPPRLAWKDVRRAIDSVDSTVPLGMRDRALLLLLATTGLRNGELRRLEIRDVRWRQGELVVRRTKGHRDRVVPLLEEPGAALADYLLRGRPKTSERRVFLVHLPPIRPLSCSGTVSRIVLNRLQRAGISVQRGGAHLLRHSLATRLVEQRRPIKEVADLLGHRSIDTTSFYVKVAVPQLAEVALPFPGGDR